MTGPSLTNETCISAPKTPVLIGVEWGRANSERKDSYNGMAISGFTERIKLGRFPFLVEANLWLEFSDVLKL